MLLGEEGSGKNAVASLLKGEDSGDSIQISEVEIPFKVIDTYDVNRFQLCMESLQNPTVHTSFVIIIDSAIRNVNSQFVWLGDLKRSLNDYELYRDSFVILTHSDQVRTEILEGKFEELLGLVEHRYICVDVTDKTFETRTRIMEQVTRFSKPNIRIVFHGNNDFSSEKMKEFLEITDENPFEIADYRIYCEFPQDLNIFYPYHDPKFDPIIPKTPHAYGKSPVIFAVHIGLHSIFSHGMLSLISSLPSLYKLGPIQENLFWRRAVVVFDVGEHPPDEMVRNALNNSGIREIMGKVDGRYNYIAEYDRREEFFERFLNRSQLGELAPPKTRIERAVRDEKTYPISTIFNRKTLPLLLFSGGVLASLLGCLLGMYCKRESIIPLIWRSKLTFGKLISHTFPT